MRLNAPARTSPVFPGLLFCLLLCCIALARPAQAGGSAPEPFAVGMRSFGVWEPETRERLDVSVWYPSRTPAQESSQEGWLLEAGKRGRMLPGLYPLVLLSHDAGSGRFANNDLAAALASGGMIVIAPSHSGDNQNASDAMYSAPVLRDRPRHLLRALETVLSSPEFAPYADESRIGLLGVGFGGVTVLQLAGALPDFARLDQYCAWFGGGDAFCASWTAERLARLPEDMRLLTQKYGGAAFTPPLDLFAPKLMRVAVAEGAPPEAASDAQPSEKPLKRSFWQRIFGNEDYDSSPEVFSAETESQPQPQANATAQSPPLPLDFQGGPRFGGTDSGSPFVHIALSDSPQYRMLVSDDKSGGISPETSPFRADASRVFRRPAEERRIRAIALMAPAGGMLFDRDALWGIRVPVAVVEAGGDALYPPPRHSQPYFGNLPVPPLVLNLPQADHFSLFARCTRNTLLTLGETCGRLVGDEREDVARKRNQFLIPFFQSALGLPLPVARPSGLVAVPPEKRP